MALGSDQIASSISSPQGRSYALMEKKGIGTCGIGLGTTFSRPMIDAAMATACSFWLDFAAHQWVNVSFGFTQIGMTDVTLSEGLALPSKLVWTWIMGDQHLSNLGAWKNQHKEVVFSMNDFDEAAITMTFILKSFSSPCPFAITP
eukprot:scaffold42240_cov60-Attheya_sp.AAC.8